MAKTVNIQDAKTRLSQLLRLVEAGEDVLIARAGRVIARLVRADDEQPRAWGSFEGEVQMEEDAFAALTEAELALWEGTSEG